MTLQLKIKKKENKEMKKNYHAVIINRITKKSHKTHDYGTFYEAQKAGEKLAKRTEVYANCNIFVVDDRGMVI